MASSPSAVHPKKKYDVFLSFRGKDTRNTFTSHLRKALDGKKLNTYIDDKLEGGDEIGPALRKSIEESKLSLIILSKGYASSIWCLDELVHILKCKERYGQFVIPIFYDIDPSHIRHQLESYAAAFAQHEQRYEDKMDKVLKWKGALTKAANLSGFDSRITRPESELVEAVVKNVLIKLNRESSTDLKGLVGLESRIQEVEMLLCIDSQDVRVRTVGIWGMGGIGKTTLAGVVYNRLCSQFEACCFLANVREESLRHGVNYLRDELLREVLKEENLKIHTPSIGSSSHKRRIGCTKVLIVLDDVNDVSQLQLLSGDQIDFGPGSRIIITTRSMTLLEEMQQLRKGADHAVGIYKVNELNCDEALQLYHLNASRGLCSGADSSELLNMVLDYAAGIPLALNIWCSLFLRCKSKQERESLLNKLKKCPDKRLQNVYRVSYDALGEDEKELFLEIACFYKGEKICDAKRQFDACGLFVDIEVLINVSLISNKNNRIWMHDVIQELGWEIVSNQCPEEPGNRSRLYTPKDVCHVLERNTGTATVRSISLDIDEITDTAINLNTQSFTKMYNLRFLRVFSKHFLRVCFSTSAFLDYRRDIPYDIQDLESLPDSLGYLYWLAYPLKHLPPEFSPKNLVELHMPHSKLQILWNTGQNPWNLKRIDLSGSKDLVKVPDLSNCRSIESINLEGCTSLVQVPSYFQSLDKLTSLKLGRCSNLQILPELPRNMEFLDLGSTAIEQLPSSIWSLEKLVQLNLILCRGIKNLPSSTWKLNSLTSLVLTRTSIHKVPSSIESLSQVATIELVGCRRLMTLPTSICKLKSLKKLSLSGCSSFTYFPKILEPMKGLEILRLSDTKIEELPWSIENLVGLKTLELSWCQSLKFVPNSIYSLNLEKIKLDGCCKLKSLPPAPVILWSSISDLDLGDCKELEAIPDCLLSHMNSLKSLNLSESMIKSIPPSIKQVSGLRSLNVRNCKHLQTLPELPSLLKNLDAYGCMKLKTVSGSMTAVTQGLDQICDPVYDYREEKHTFLNCLNLDKNSRSNIMNDAQLRIMRMASAISKRKEINLKYGRRGRFSVSIVCPGNEIPKWFSYQTEGYYIKNIKLPPNWSDATFLGFALCAVVTMHNDLATRRSLTFKCQSHFKTNNGEDPQIDFDLSEIDVSDRGDDGNSGNVFMWYHAFELLDGKKWSTHFYNATEASFSFFESGHHSIVKSCGISLLYAQDALEP